MKMPLAKLKKYFVVDKLIYHSVDLSLYMVSAMVEGEEYYIADNSGNFLKSHKLMSIMKWEVILMSSSTKTRHFLVSELMAERNRYVVLTKT